MSCIYPSYVGQAYAYTHLIPWIVPLIILAFSWQRDRKTGHYRVELVTNLYSTWLSWGALWVWELQAAFQVMRHDPYCPDQVSAAFPSMEAYYTSSIVTSVILFTYLWNIPLSETYWVVCIAFLGGPALLLVWFTYNTTYEVLVSILMGIVVALVFWISVRFFFVHHFDALIKQQPFSWVPFSNNTPTKDEEYYEE
jgi:hypothetical protein